MTKKRTVIIRESMTDIRFCSFDCRHAKAENATSAAKSCMTFNGVYCRKLRRRVPKGAPCQVPGGGNKKTRQRK